MAILVNERDKLLSTTVPRLVDPSESDPLVVTASSPLLKYVANPASPSELLPSGSITLYALTSRIGDVSWSIIGGPITGVTLSASVGSTVNLTFTNALVNDSVGVLASINNTNYSPASVQITLNFTKQLPAKSIKNLTIYKRGTVTPSTPTGGNYVFSSNTLVPPSGWSFGIPSGTDPVYSSTTQVFTYKDDSDVAINTSGWAAPVLTVQNGTNGTNGSDATVTINNIKSAIESGSSTTINLQNHSEFFKSSNSSTTGVFIGAGGLYGKKAGVTTFAISNTGDVEFVGNIKGGSNLDINGTATFNGSTGVSGFGNSTVAVNSPVGNSAGIYVYSNAGGVHALTSGATPNAAAVAGLAPSTNSTLVGVYGYANAGIGISGTSNNNVGVYGWLGSSVGFGVHAENSHTSGGTIGAGAGLRVTGGFKWGSVKWADPSNTGTKFLRDDGTWATPGGSSGVTSFNSRTGAVTLNSTDVANAVAGTGVTLQANITGNAGSASYASSAGNASTLGGYDGSNYLRGTGGLSTSPRTLIGYLPVIGAGTNVWIAIY